MLKTNGDCNLPCWWGITPGVSTFDATRNFFLSQGVFWSPEGGIAFDQLKSDHHVAYNIRLGFLQEQGKIQSIEVYGEVFPENGGATQFARDWKRYALNEILTQYGIPTAVWLYLATPIDPQALPEFGFTVIYENLGLLLDYGGQANDDEGQLIACPRINHITHIFMKLQQADSGKLLLQSNDPYILPLEQSTGMSVATFYKIFKEPENNNCIKATPTAP